MSFLSPQFQEILGVHHTKFAVFDNSIILTGANFEEQYFLNRRDRYWIINDCPELADYLEDYALNLLSACELIAWDGESYGVSAREKKSSSLMDRVTQLTGLIGSSSSYSSLSSGIGNQTKGLSQKEFKSQMKHMMGVFTYIGYKDAIEMKNDVEKKMISGVVDQGDLQLEEEVTDIAIASGESKEEVFQG